MAIIKLNATTGLTGSLPAVSGANLTGITAGGLVLISTTNISNGDSQVELTFSSSYDNYRLIISGLVPQSTGGTDARIYLKRSGQSSYDSSSGNYWRVGYDMRGESNAMNLTATTTQSGIQLLGWNIDSDNVYANSYNICEIGNVNSNVHTMFDTMSLQYPRGNNTDSFAMTRYHYFHSQAGTLTNLKLQPVSGNWKSGKVLFYGYRET
tara:strand:+ start:33 stop:659 length:627 start_codon:yes stop_codon:yes gene_type:complete